MIGSSGPPHHALASYQSSLIGLRRSLGRPGSRLRSLRVGKDSRLRRNSPIGHGRAAKGAFWEEVMSSCSLSCITYSQQKVEVDC